MEPTDTQQPDEPRTGGLIALVPRRARIAIAVAAVLAFVGSVVHLPYHSVSPGPTRDVLAFLKVSGVRAYPSEGKLLLTTASVSDRTLTVWESLRAFVDPREALIKREFIVQPGLTREQQDAVNTADIEVSKMRAQIAAYASLGCRITRAPGARVVGIVEDGPSDGRLKIGDRIVAVGRRSIRTADDAVAAIRRYRVGQRVRVAVVRDGRPRTVRLRTGRGFGGPGASSRPTVGAFLFDVYRLPREVRINTAKIGGPSGGLVFALAVAEAFTREDLTRGRTIAATGTIDATGVVGSVGAVSEKVRGAVRDGASIFVVPKEEEQLARAEAPPTLTIVGVRTLRDAVVYLRGPDAKPLRLPAVCRRASS